MDRFADLVLKQYQRETLQLLLDRPDKRFTVNEVVKHTAASYNTVKAFLDDLAGYGIVRFERSGNARLVEYDRDNRYHDLLTDIFTVDDTARREAARAYAEELYEGREDDIASIILFGSSARGTATKDSDIDVLVLTHGENTVSGDVATGRIATGGPDYETGIVPVTESLAVFRNNLEQGKRFEKNVVRDGIVLVGESIEELTEETR